MFYKVGALYVNQMERPQKDMYNKKNRQWAFELGRQIKFCFPGREE